MFVRDEAKILSRMEEELCILASCFFESDEQDFSLRGVKSKKISSHPGRDLLIY